MGTIKLNKYCDKSEALALKQENFSIDTLDGSDGQAVAEQLIERVEDCEFAEKDGGFVEEIKGLRTANETVYRRNDGTCRKIITASPTRYRDGNGKYKKISNKLIDNGQEIVNEANSFNVKFNKNAQSGKIFDLQRDEKKLTLSTVGTLKSRGHVCGCKCELCAGTDNTVMATLDDGTEIEYVTLSDRIKENIIIKERQESYEYDFKLDIGDLVVEEGEHNDLLLKDKQSGETEFRIPAPYMFDANKKRSNKVSYEIDVNGSELEIKVVADAEFINAAERTFPVIIDPQIIDQKNVYEGITVLKKTEGLYSDEEYDIEEGSDVKPEARDDGREYVESDIHYKAPTSITEGHIVGIKLVMGIDTGMGEAKVRCITTKGERIYGTGPALLRDDIFNAGMNDTNIEFDVGIGGEGNIAIRCEDYSNGRFNFELYIPYFVVDYIEVPEAYKGQEFNANNPPMIKDFDFTDKATGHVYAKYGTLATSFKSFEAEDFVLPLNISHCHKVGIGKTEFGMDWRLSLNRKLKSRGTGGYLYIDELGDKYILSESYYYADGDNIYTISKQSVTIDVNGNMTYGGKPVYKYQTFNGLTLIPEIKDFINYDLVQQKSDEIIQLEDYINQLTPSLKSYVKVEISSGKIVSELSGELGEASKSYFDSIVNEVKAEPDKFILLSKSEALQLQSLYANINQLQLQKRQLLLQEKQILQQEQELVFSYRLSERINPHSSTVLTVDSVSKVDGNDATAVSQFREHISYQNAIRNLILLKRGGNEDTQYKILLEQINRDGSVSIDKQIAQVKAQIIHLINQAKENFNLLKETFVRYFSKLQELKMLKKQTPVNYLRDENEIISGFNADGDLVLVCDKYGNAVNIVYDTKNRISEIYDSQGKTMNFEYQGNLLYRITDNLGRRVQYSYKGIELMKVVCADGSFIDFEYQGKYNIVRSVMSSTDFQAKVSVDEYNRVTNIATNSKPVTIGTEVSKEKDSFNKTIANIAVDYDKNESGELRTTFTSKDNKTERYTFNSANRVKLIEQTDNNFVKTVTTLNYGNFGNVVKSTEQHDINGTEEESLSYNLINQLTYKASGWKNISDTVKVKTETLYSYDGSGNLIKEITTKQTDVGGTITPKTKITNYSYNPQGSLVLTESYIDGEETTAGKNYEKRVYDENGKVTKTISWNSLDSTSKFYTESDRAENGQVTADRDETGEVSAEYEYVDGTNVVNSVKYPNGSKFAYGRNPNNFEITGITQSTDDGEANVTDIAYNYGLPVEVKSGNTTLGYTYDHTRRKTAVTVNGATQATYTYKDYTYNTNQNKCTFGEQTTVLDDGNGTTTTILQSKTGVLDTESGRIKTTEVTKINGSEKCRKEYDVNGRLISAKDSVSGTRTYVYDNYDNVTNISGGGLTEAYEYNEYGNVTTKALTNAVTQTYSYAYKENSSRDLDYITFDNYKFIPLTDVNGRNTGKEIYSGENKLAGEYITYRKVGDHATNMPACMWFGSGKNIADSIKYKYDSCGNICQVTKNGHVVAKYTYDSLNRLIREDNKAIGKTTLFTYDNTGNITERCEYAYTSKSGEELEELKCTHYSYDYEGDKLVNYNGEEFVYNNLGCPTTYRGETVTWVYGKMLASYKGVTFTYNGNESRASKGGITFTYDSDGRLIKQSNGLEFIYDNAGIVGVEYNGARYFYRKDAQGNIIAILDSNGNAVVYYEYDAWGNHAALDASGKDITSGIGVLNPFRYRGYYYDEETELYYLQTRYYDPEIGRFISQDSLEYADPETINGLNLYAYCGDNPVMFADPNGTAKWWQWLTGIVIIVAAVALSVVTAGLAAPISTALGGGMLGSIVGGAVAGAIGGAITGFGMSVAVQGISNGFNNINWASVGYATLGGAITGAILGGIGGGVKYARAANYLKANGISDVKGTLNNFKGIPSVKTSKGITAYRYYDNIGAFQKGRYLTNALTNNPIKDLVLYDNQATMVSKFIINDGAKYLVGRIAGSTVNALQYFVANINWLTLL